MEGDANAPQDIAALLQSLTAYLPRNQQQLRQETQYDQKQYQPQVANSALRAFTEQSLNGEQPQQYYQQQTYAPTPYQDHASSHTPQQAPPQRPTPAEPGISKPTQARIDSPKITTWPAALRYITKLSGTNDDFLPRVRALIKNQRDNERQWWAGREALIEQQAARLGGKQELDDVLLSIGVEASKDHGTNDNDAEMKRYDLKVHKAQTKMVHVITAELKGLGLPFLANDQTDPEMRNKMLEFLEELCKD